MPNSIQEPSAQDAKHEQFITAMQRAWLLCDDFSQRHRLWCEYCLALKSRSDAQADRILAARGKQA